MLIIDRDDATTPVTFTIRGVIDETVDFEEAFGEMPREASICCLEIKRINSVGIKLWREYFTRQRAKPVALKFVQLAPAIVSTLNYLKDFIHRSEIGSVGAPYHCSKCNATTVKIYSMDELTKLQTTMPNIKCPECGADAEFDEIPEEYLSFLG